MNFDFIYDNHFIKFYGFFITSDIYNLNIQTFIFLKYKVK